MIYLLIALAAVFNAVMDVLENENFHQSKFRYWKERFWYKRESWKWANHIGNYPIDGWHLAKSCMILCFSAAVANSVLQFILIGIVWNVTFNLFYKWIKSR